MLIRVVALVSSFAMLSACQHSRGCTAAEPSPGLRLSVSDFSSRPGLVAEVCIDDACSEAHRTGRGFFSLFVQNDLRPQKVKVSVTLTAGGRQLARAFAELPVTVIELQGPGCGKTRQIAASLRADGKLHAEPVPKRLADDR